MSDLAKTAIDRREAMALDLAAYKALAREQMETIRRLAEENQDLRMELHGLQPDGEWPEDKPLVGCCGPTGPSPCGKADCVLCTPFGGG